MKEWQLLDSAQTPDGSSMTLSRRGPEFLIMADGQDLFQREIRKLGVESPDRRALLDLGQCRHQMARPVDSTVADALLSDTEDVKTLTRCRVFSLSREVFLQLIEDEDNRLRQDTPE